MYYQRIKAALREKPECTLMPDYFMAPKYTAKELADLAGCAESSIRKYIQRLRQDGYDIRKNADNEFYIEVEPEYRHNFSINIKPAIFAGEAGHSIFSTHNGSEWSGMTLRSLRELRELHERLGDYIEEVIREAGQDRTA